MLLPDASKTLDTIKTTPGRTGRTYNKGFGVILAGQCNIIFNATISSISSRRNSYGLLFVIFIFCNFIQQQYRAGSFSNAKNNAKPCPLCGMTIRRFQIEPCSRNSDILILLNLLALQLSILFRTNHTLLLTLHAGLSF